MSSAAIDLTSTDVFDIMHTTRAMRRLKPDPVPDDMIVKILDVGIRAPNGGNSQTWHFVVVKDAAIKKAVLLTCLMHPADGIAPVASISDAALRTALNQATQASAETCRRRGADIPMRATGH